MMASKASLVLRQAMGLWGLLIANMKFKFGLSIVLAIALLGIIGPFLTPDPLTYHWEEGIPPLPPLTRGHILGTTAPWGQDVFAQLCTGIRNSLFVGIIGGGLGTLIAVLMGALGPYKGGLADDITNFITNIIMVFPVYPALLALSAIVEKREILSVAVLIALTSWPWAARAIRSQVLSLKEREFVNLAKLSGMRSRDIVLKEVLPNMMAYVTMVFVLLTGGAMLAETGISILGIGPVPQLYVTLGNMIYNCMSNPMFSWRNIWWWYIPPGAVLTILLSAIFIIHAGMDEVFNPRLRRA
jgi:peptide/nickel transport system permease protein